MITTQNEYLSKLDILQNINNPAYALLPTAEKFYEINVNTREVAPITLSSIQRDHKAETLYFTVKRFVDYMISKPHKDYGTPVKELTIKQIEDLLGYKIKIVGEH